MPKVFVTGASLSYHLLALFIPTVALLILDYPVYPLTRKRKKKKKKNNDNPTTFSQPAATAREIRF